MNKQQDEVVDGKRTASKSAGHVLADSEASHPDAAEADPKSLPRIKSKPRWPQFGLRTLLLVTVGSSASFGWVGNEKHRAKYVAKFEQMRPPGSQMANDPPAVEFRASSRFAPRRILKSALLLLRVSRDTQLSLVADDVDRIHLRYAHTNNDDMIGVELMPEAVYLDISNSAVSDIGITRLRGMRQLEELYAGGGEHAKTITDEGFRQLSKISKLRTLELRRTSITGAGLAPLKHMPKLEFLSLWGSDIDDAGVPHLKQLTRLKKLVVAHTKLSRTAIKELEQALPNCEIVWRG